MVLFILLQVYIRLVRTGRVPNLRVQILDVLGDVIAVANQVRPLQVCMELAPSDFKRKDLLTSVKVDFDDTMPDCGLEILHTRARSAMKDKEDRLSGGLA